MGSKLEEFKKFIRNYPGLRDEVKNGKRTWQEIYEEWVLMGEDVDWDDYKEIKKKSSITSLDNQELIQTVINYAKKLNPDDITKTISTVQKVVGLVQSFSGGLGKTTQNVGNNRRVDPIFKRYDDYFFDGD